MEETPDRAQLYRDHRTGPSSNQPLNVAGTVSEAGTVAVESETVPEKDRPTDSSPEVIRPEVIRLVQPDSREASDLKLLRRAGAGDAKAFHQLLDGHADRLFRLAYSLLGNAADAEDVVQETLAGAYRGIQGFEGRSSVGTWLTRILVTQAAKWRRDRKRPMQSIDAIAAQGKAAVATSFATSGGVLAAEKRIDLRAALEKLSSEHKQVLVLREFEQMSYEEIAQVLGLPRGTVESRLHRARAELREKLKAYAT